MFGLYPTMFVDPFEFMPMGELDGLGILDFGLPLGHDSN